MTTSNAQQPLESAPRSAKARLCVEAHYVSAKSLARRLDCSETTIHAYVSRRILPAPIHIGELVRWRWIDVEARIESLESGSGPTHHDDPFLKGLS